MGFVVVGIDGSPMSVRALEWACDYADQRDQQVVAVTGYGIPWTIFITPTYQESDYANDAERMLTDAVRQVTDSRPRASIEARLVPEKPAVALTMASRGADLLIVGAHGHGGAPDLHIGSVANACVNHAPCPVVVYRDYRGPDIG